jgi:hypothetical protein
MPSQNISVLYCIFFLDVLDGLSQIFFKKLKCLAKTSCECNSRFYLSKSSGLKQKSIPHFPHSAVQGVFSARSSGFDCEFEAVMIRVKHINIKVTFPCL